MTAAGAGGGGWTPDVGTWSGMVEALAALFGPWVGPGRGVVWTTGFESVAAGEKWHGRAGTDHLRAKFADMNADLYFAIGVMREGAPHRSNNEVVAQPLLIVDDIGTKVDVAEWEKRFAAGCPRPSAQIETSPGNETWIWALDGDARNPQRWADLALVRAWLVDARLTDEVMDPARYIRLPGGWNSKPKYRGEDGAGEPPRVRLTRWRLGPGGSGRVDLDALAVTVVGDVGSWGTGAWGDWRDAKFPDTASGRGLMTSAQVGAALGSGALVRTADLSKPDALLRLAVEVGMQPEQRRVGVVEALCPNVGAHTTRAETGFAFLGGGLMHCNHASCQGLATADFRAMMLARMDEKEGRVGAGAEWWARECVRDAGGLSDADEALAVAGRMAGASAARAAEAEAALARGLDGLAERFVWLNPLSAFFDLFGRRIVPDAQIDTHPDVLAIVPVGQTGAKRARNRLLNHAAMKFLDGVVREAGDERGVVKVTDDRGEVKTLANVWVASPYMAGWRQGLRVRRYPVEWFELLEHVIPDADYRGWLVKWLAWKVQHPRLRLMTIPLIVGGQGIGKDALLAPIKEILGRHNVSSLTMNQIGGQFTEWMLTDLVILPELKLSGDGKMYNQIKDWLSNAEEWVAINEKFQRPYLTRVHFSMISMTNHLNALSGLEVDDRRWQTYVSPANPRDADWYKRVVGGACEAGAVAGLLDFLMTVDLSDFSPFEAAPGARDAKQAMLADTLKGAAQWAYQAVTEEGGRFEGRNLLTLAEVEQVAAADPNRRVSGSADTGALRDGLRAAGWECVGQIRQAQGRKYLWASPTLRNSPFYADMPPKALMAAYVVEQKNHQISLTKNLFGSLPEN